MGISSEMKESWAKRRESLLIASAFEEDRIRKSRECTQEGVRAGTKAAAVACVASAIPTLLLLHTSLLLTRQSWSAQGETHTTINLLKMLIRRSEYACCESIYWCSFTLYSVLKDIYGSFMNFFIFAHVY
ncbi:uncharacterized protein LOC107838908 isoform X1 [Capsicum annuum]|uniref:uncharacterized protein LOC107838908 isoform X1 n=1 Tax=Capsicum annuum TaxID=4072 RepID=UPI001FB0C4F5|nr:uncharacterized protein LOC107838908 isoform X1 [Capsicum annuum]XP_047251704.1 uncharacterized protein LOC107838908 isoform X1 [Capsicum annuum]